MRATRNNVWARYWWAYWAIALDWIICWWPIGSCGSSKVLDWRGTVGHSFGPAACARRTNRMSFPQKKKKKKGSQLHEEAPCQEGRGGCAWMWSGVAKMGLVLWFLYVGTGPPRAPILCVGSTEISGQKVLYSCINSFWLPFFFIIIHFGSLDSWGYKAFLAWMIVRINH